MPRLLRILLTILALALSASPAWAERLSFDHRLYPALKAALDSGNGELVHNDSRNPKYIYNLIVVQGTAYANWTEALEIVTRLPDRGMVSARDWQAELQARGPRGCTAQIVAIAEDAESLTFERRLPGCRAAVARTGLYRIIAGKRSLFLLGALYKGDLTPEMRARWLELLASAHLEG